jgi:uracil-DNA glycosylase
MHENIIDSWKSHLKYEFEKDYFKKLAGFLMRERNKYDVFPPEKQTFAALNQTKIEEIKVVIIGQDPYHNIGQANGLSFSVTQGVKLPPSLRNIFIELRDDVGGDTPKSGDLKKWAEQGVLLLNATLSVRAHEAASHQKKGWEIFTDKIIHLISQKCKNVVFILWGNFAQKKIKIIDDKKHFIIKSVHPSPFSARNGFFGSKPFSKCNEYLTSVNKETIDWKTIDDCHQLSILD